MDIVYAKSSAQIGDGIGGPLMVRKGTHWPANDPIVKAHPDLFSSDPRWGLFFTEEPSGYRDEAPVEQATRAPGEKRPSRRAASSTTP